MSKAQELAAIFMDQLKWMTTPISRTEVAAELLRLESEYNATLANWQSMQTAYEAEKATRRRLQKENTALFADKAELLEALKLADALLWGANMDAHVVEEKVRAAIQKHGGQA